MTVRYRAETEGPVVGEPYQTAKGPSTIEKPAF
jgi:hypothetical protein